MKRYLTANKWATFLAVWSFAFLVFNAVTNRPVYAVLQGAAFGLAIGLMVYGANRPGARR
jgi:Flp pilus assembly protein protease CpaA